VEREIEAELPPVMGDPFGVSQCLQNLMTNALKYGGESAWLGIRAIRADNGSGAEIQVSISDRGIGIDPSAQRAGRRQHLYLAPALRLTGCSKRPRAEF
jgi:signal transduction histidine kinase